MNWKRVVQKLCIPSQIYYSLTNLWVSDHKKILSDKHYMKLKFFDPLAMISRISALKISQ